METKGATLAKNTISIQKISAHEVLYELDMAIRSAGLALSQHLVAPDIYDRFSEAINSFALDRRRNYFYPKSYFNEFISSNSDIVVDFVKDSFDTLVTIYRNNQDELPKIVGIGNTSNILLRNLVTQDSTTFIANAKYLFNSLKDMYNSNSNVLLDKQKRIKIFELTNLIMSYAALVYELLSLFKSSKRTIDEFDAIYEEVLLKKFILSSAVMTANVLGHWSDKVIRSKKNNFIDAEFIIVLMSIGSIMSYLLNFYNEIYDEYENKLDVIRKGVSKKLLHHFANVVDLWHNIVMGCGQNIDCVVDSLQNSYDDALNFPHFDALMFLISKYR